ncbi:MAG: aspartate--tRNA ligase [Nanoarchaeota archaeon]|nr:aspartate--tRNA ligase [Nanoarchaeota archaeon]
MVRTHTCGELNISNDKKDVSLIGWAQRIRDHGGKKFIDLRDREGITQVVFDPDVTKNFSEVETFKREFLIEINGTVRPRPEGTVNKKHATGEIEVLVKSFKIENKCAVLPFDLDEEHYNEVSEELRLEYRYLDLRRKEMLDIMKRRHKLYISLRKFLDAKGFIEVETPLLTKSTPEGARDFLVPYRKKEGEFFALPQSPQLFKQLLMVSGFEKYFQIATCLRDEDLRKDRQYEHKQLDMEMSFTTRDEAFKLAEDLFVNAFEEVYNIKVPRPFPVFTFEEVMDKYGSDKPDLRIEGLELKNISDIALKCGFSVFKGIVERGGLVKGMRVIKGQDKLSRKDIDKLIAFCQENGAKGMAWMKVMEDKKIESSITKFFTDEELVKINNRLGGEEGDLLFFIADTKSTTNDVLDSLRRHLAKLLNLIDESKDIMYWIVEFPLFHWDEGADKLDFEHNPFSMPLQKDIDYLKKLNKKDLDKKEVREKVLSLVSDCYDLVYNGVEISSGAARIHLPELQSKMFELVDFSKERIEDAFGWFIKAYDYGAPSHRGFGFGIERMMMIAERKESIRDVIPFPRNKHGFDPLTRSPSSIDETQLKDLSLKVVRKNKSS